MINRIKEQVRTWKGAQKNTQNLTKNVYLHCKKSLRGIVHLTLFFIYLIQSNKNKLIEHIILD